MNLTDEQKKNIYVVLFLAGVCIAGLAYSWYMLGKDKVEQYKQAVEKAQTQEAEYRQELKEILEFQQMTEGRWEEIEAKVAAIEKRLPQTRQAIGFFQALELILRNTGVTNEKLAPEPTSVQTRYEEIPYSIRATGLYHEFGQFLNLVEQNPERFMRVKTFTVTNKAEEPTFHPLDVKIATFRFIQR